MGGEVALGGYWADGWWYLRLGKKAKNTHLLPAKEKVCTRLTSCKSRKPITSTDQRCKGISSLYFLSLILLLSTWALVVLSVVQKSSWRPGPIEPGNKTIRNDHKELTLKSDKRGEG